MDETSFRMPVTSSSYSQIALNQVFELAQLKMIRMIIDDQCDVKNVFEPADWLKDPFDVTFDPD